MDSKRDEVTEQLRCQRCGVALTGQALGELCANCLLGLALNPPDEFIVGSETPDAVPSGSSRLRYFGDYELIEEIARGGMGVVFKARQVSLNRVVALKMILSGDFSSPLTVERFRTEAEAAARLEHPNIASVYETGAHEGQHYFSMRLLEGGTLTERIQREREHPTPKAAPTRHGCIGFKAAAAILMKVARAVHHAHQRGILHRDLKPGNILFDETGEPMVADFGLAKLLEGDSSLTLSATVLGTPSYMAPEQAAGHSSRLTTGADIYSLGAILYELLTGRVPFRGATPTETLRQVIEAEPPSPRSLNPTVDRDLQTICLKCLEKDPARRYGSADALADDLQRWLAHEPIHARRTTVPELVIKWARRKPVVAGLVLALHLVGIAGLTGILLQSRRANHEAQRASSEAVKARAEFARAEAELWNANFNEAKAIRIAGGSGARARSSALLKELLKRPGLTETQLLGLREEAIAQLALMDMVTPQKWIEHSGDLPVAWDSRLERYVWNAGGGRIELREFPSEKTLAGFSAPLSAVFDQAKFSADDQFVGVRFANGEARIWKVADGEELLRATGVRYMAFSPDNRTLMTVLNRGIALQAVARNSVKRVLYPNLRVVRAAFSPDSKYLAVLPDNASNTVEFWDTSSGAVCGSFGVDFPPRRVAWHPDGTRLALGGDRGRLELRHLAMEELESIRVGEPVALAGRLGSIQRLVFSQDGSKLFSHGWGSPFTVAWDLISGRTLLGECPEFVTINPEADRVAVTRERTTTVATLMNPTGYRTVAYAGEPRETYSVSVSPDGRLAVASFDSTVARTEGDCILWDFQRGCEIARVKGLDAVFSMDSQALFTFERYDANRVRRYDVSPATLANRASGWRDGSLVYRGKGDETVNSGAMAPDGRTLIVAATTAVLFIDTLGRKPIRSWRKPAFTVAPSADGKWVATTYHAWQPSTLRSVTDGTAAFRAPDDGSLRVSAVGRWMASVDKTSVRMYGFDKTPFAAIYTNQMAEPGALAFSPNNQQFAVVVDQTHVRLCEISTGRELATLTPPNLAPIRGGRALTFSPDGRWLLAAKQDGEVVAWDLPTIRRELAKLGLDWEDQP